jgi:hypothetical protein
MFDAVTMNMPKQQFCQGSHGTACCCCYRKNTCGPAPDACRKRYANCRLMVVPLER